MHNTNTNTLTLMSIPSFIMNISIFIFCYVYNSNSRRKSQIKGNLLGTIKLYTNEISFPLINGNQCLQLPMTEQIRNKATINYVYDLHHL